MLLPRIGGTVAARTGRDSRHSSVASSARAWLRRGSETVARAPDYEGLKLEGGRVQEKPR